MKSAERARLGVLSLTLTAVGSVPTIGCHDSADTGSPAACPADDGVYTKLIAGENGVCGLDGDGWATCWGSLATGAMLDEPFVAIDAEYRTVCGITTSGRNVCWGTSGPGYVPPDGEFADVAVSDSDSCWLDAGGAVTCVGPDPCDRAEDPATCSFATPDGDSVDIDGGQHSFCAAGVDGQGTCWGITSDEWQAWPADVDTFALMSSSLCYQDTDGVYCYGIPDTVGPLQIWRGVARAIAPGNFFGCVVDDAGGAHCEGNIAGTLVEQASSESPFLTEVGGWATTWGGNLLCAAYEAGGIECWTWYDFAPGTHGHPCDAPWDQDPT